jgi:predicted nucleic acid-binding protein
MTIVVDASVLIDHLRGVDGARDSLRNAAKAGERLAASVMTKIEVLAGMRVNEEPATRRLLDSLDLIEVDDTVANVPARSPTAIYVPNRVWILSTTS